MNPVNSINDMNNSVDDNFNDNFNSKNTNSNEFIPLTKCHRFIFRTVLVEETLLESNHIYDYCALVSKSHLSIIHTKDDQYSSSDNTFVKISLIRELDQIKSKDVKNKVETKNLCLIVRLCPLDPYMNNIENMEIITWPTIYVTNVLSKMLGLKMNSKVVLEPVTQIDNEIYSVQNICITPSKEMVGF